MRLALPTLAAVAVVTLAACSTHVDPVNAADPRVDEQWGLDAVNSRSSWEYATGKDVVIAIVDTGVDDGHRDLRAQMVGGYDFVDDDRNPKDENGHGTHVAGIAAAAANDYGIIGAAPEAKIMPVRALDAEGSGSNETIAEAIDWAVDHGANVINLSLDETGLLGRIEKGGPVNAAITRADEAGVVVVAASGNAGEVGQQYQFGVHVLVVNASNKVGTATYFSNVGDARAVAAPGMDILSTVPTYSTTLFPDGSDGYATLAGTSMAAPLVAGVAAQLISAGVPSEEVIDLLTETASNPDDRPGLGNGIIDARAALVEAVDRGFIAVD
ncbi:S8 family serine peptidase [Demequina sp. NBRC 110055]|uniref:S8 family serine peptidase n=1 Tax=Demequina sp. NBRC 110055 TaxID=1570344 RepID=UPI0011853255|nr:S8 family serine peptidase [Demequina sp. NBRC 110055]